MAHIPGHPLGFGAASGIGEIFRRRREAEGKQFIEETRATAGERASPLLEALRGFRGLQLPGVQRREFSTFAQRGFGLSGAARRGVRQRTAVFQARTKSQEQDILRQALADVIQEQQLERQIARGG